MINIINKYKRVSLIISQDLLDQVSILAIKEGENRSKIINKWINEIVELKLFPTSKIKKVNFTLRTDTFNFNKIKIESQKFGISSSDYIRLVILNSLNKTTLKKEDTDFDLKTLWNKSEFRSIIESTKNSLDTLSSDDLKIVIEAKLKIADYADIENTFSLFKKKSEDKNIDLLIELYRSQIKYSIEQLGAPAFFNNIFEYLIKTDDKELIGKTYFQKSKFYESSDVNFDAVYYCEKALEYLNIVDNFQEVLLIYLELVKIYNYRMDNINSTKYIAKVADLLKERDDKYIRYKLHTKNGMNEYLQGNDNLAEEELRKSIKINTEKYQAISNLSDNYHYLGRIYLGRHNLDQAVKYFSISENYENGYRNNRWQCSGEIFKEFVKSYSNYDESISTLEKILDSKKYTLKTDTVKYILSSAKFINGGEDDQTKGELVLKELADKKSFGLIGTAAQNTLREKELQPLR